MTETLEFSGRDSRLRHGLVVAGLVCLVALLFYFFGGGAAENHQTIGLGLLALGGVMAIVAFRHKDAPADLRAGREGLWIAELDLTVPWREIEDCYISGSRLKPLLILKIKNPESFSSRLTTRDRERLRASPYIRLPDLRIPASSAGNRLLPLRDHVLSKIGEDHE